MAVTVTALSQLIAAGPTGNSHGVQGPSGERMLSNPAFIDVDATKRSGGRAFDEGRPGVDRPRPSSRRLGLRLPRTEEQALKFPGGFPCAVSGWMAGSELKRGPSTHNTRSGPAR